MEPKQFGVRIGRRRGARAGREKIGQNDVHRHGTAAYAAGAFHRGDEIGSNVRVHREHRGGRVRKNDQRSRSSQNTHGDPRGHAVDSQEGAHHHAGILIGAGAGKKRGHRAGRRRVAARISRVGCRGRSGSRRRSRSAAGAVSAAEAIHSVQNKFLVAGAKREQRDEKIGSRTKISSQHDDTPEAYQGEEAQG
jgi:hypothetical protein